ncbi:hypothetical protein CP8484711_0425, partial [Chlamydia psittaci 84-8471/1]
SKSFFSIRALGPTAAAAGATPNFKAGGEAVPSSETISLKSIVRLLIAMPPVAPDPLFC